MMAYGRNIDHNTIVSFIAIEGRAWIEAKKDAYVYLVKNNK